MPHDSRCGLRVGCRGQVEQCRNVGALDTLRLLSAMVAGAPAESVPEYVERIREARPTGHPSWACYQGQEHGWVIEVVTWDRGRSSRGWGLHTGTGQEHAAPTLVEPSVAGSPEAGRPDVAAGAWPRWCARGRRRAREGVGACEEPRIARTVAPGERAAPSSWGHRARRGSRALHEGPRTGVSGVAALTTPGGDPLGVALRGPGGGALVESAPQEWVGIVDPAPCRRRDLGVGLVHAPRAVGDAPR